MSILKALEEIGSKAGIIAALFCGWMYMEITDLKERIEQLDRTTADLSEMKQDISAINAKLEMLLNYNLKEQK